MSVILAEATATSIGLGEALTIYGPLGVMLALSIWAIAKMWKWSVRLLEGTIKESSEVIQRNTDAFDSWKREENGRAKHCTDVAAKLADASVRCHEVEVVARRQSRVAAREAK